MTTNDRFLYALDPGTTQSALVWFGIGGAVCGRIYPNDELLREIRRSLQHAEVAHLVIEQIESFGMPVGREVFETVFWAGRFAEAWGAQLQRTWSLLPRRAVKMALCNSAKAKDPNIRQALIDRYGGPACAKKGGVLAELNGWRPRRRRRRPERTTKERTKRSRRRRDGWSVSWRPTPPPRLPCLRWPLGPSQWKKRWNTT